MMIKVICYNFLLSQLKTDLLCFLRLFKDVIIKDLELVISRVYSKRLRMNKPREEILKSIKFNAKNKIVIIINGVFLLRFRANFSLEDTEISFVS